MWALLGLALAVVRCDEGCGGVSTRQWQTDPDAWQWPVVGILGGAGLLLAFVLAGLVVRGKGRWAVACLVLQVGCAAAWIALVALNQRQVTEQATVAALAALAALGAIAVRRRGRAPEPG